MRKGRAENTSVGANPSINSTLRSLLQTFDKYLLLLDPLFNLKGSGNKSAEADVILFCFGITQISFASATMDFAGARSLTLLLGGAAFN